MLRTKSAVSIVTSNLNMAKEAKFRELKFNIGYKIENKTLGIEMQGISKRARKDELR